MSELNWQVEIRSVPERGLEAQQEATAAERADVASTLNLLALDRLQAGYLVERLSRGRFRATGQVEADLVQSCVVTLEPVRETIEESFDVEFWPRDEIPETLPPGDAEALAPEPPEPIENGKLEIGRMVFEHLATAINPYPRSPGAEFATGETEETLRSQAAENPFAVLGRLKKG